MASEAEGKAITAALTAYAVAHSDALRSTLEKVRQQRGLGPDRAGLLVANHAVTAMSREELWALAAKVDLQTCTGLAGYVPVLITRDRQACLAWLGPFGPAAPGALS